MNPDDVLLGDWDTCPECEHWGHRHRLYDTDGAHEADCDLCEDRTEWGGKPCTFISESKRQP